MAKLNCWEVRDCGREPGGVNAASDGVCPAATDWRLNRVHDGVNGGRACWAVIGTLCGGERQGSYGRKLAHCRECDFFKRVVSEESSELIPATDLIAILE